MIKDMAKTINSLSHRHDRYQVFSDFVEMSAISIQNSMYCNSENDIIKQLWQKHETRYFEIIKRYEKKELDEFAKLLGMLTMALEEPSDILGSLFHELELHNEAKGQFFTPYCLSQMMAQMVSPDNYQEIVDKRGFITASEPACGSGAMVIALADTMKRQDVNFQDCLHVTAVDVDPRCVHMCYTQLSLLHIPAVVIHGNTLTMEEHAHWFTPAHILGDWDSRLKFRRMYETITDIIRACPTDTAVEERDFAKVDIDFSKPPQQLTMF